MSDILKNEEINTTIYTIGAGVGAGFSAEDANYDKIIMTDADTMVPTFKPCSYLSFYRYMRPQEAGRYIALPPFIRCRKAKGKKEEVATLDR